MNLKEDLKKVPLWHRLAWAKDNLEPQQTDYVVVFEDDIDKPARILVPDPNWLACAKFGGILPPVETYHRLEHTPDGSKLLNGHILHEETIDPLTEEEAIEYLIKKDMPDHVWKDYEKSNRPKFRICKRSQLPKTRLFRNAWKLNE